MINTQGLVRGAHLPRHGSPDYMVPQTRGAYVVKPTLDSTPRLYRQCDTSQCRTQHADLGDGHYRIYPHYPQFWAEPPEHSGSGGAKPPQERCPCST